MKKIIHQLREFARLHKPLHIIAVLIFCSITLTLNYKFGLKQYLQSLTSVYDFFGAFLLYGTHLGFGYLVYSIFFNNYQFWRKPGFWALFVFCVSAFSFRESFPNYYQWIADYSLPQNISYNQKTYRYLFRVGMILLPVACWWYWVDKKEQPFYGFSAKNQSYKVYVLLLLGMIPLLIFASTQTDFLNYYPIAKRLNTEQLPAWRYLLFELCYGSDFIGIELFFRGFLVLAFAKYVGIHAVLPMACFYLSIHFGKPFGEALSSLFGGTILGVIAYHTRSIYGGIFIHLGVAWLMELGGFIGNMFNK